jgi:hypothetical protein
VVTVKSKPVVHAVPVSVRHGKNVIALAVGVIDDDVEHRHASELWRVLVYEGDHPPLLILTLEDVFPPGLRYVVRRNKIHRVLGGVSLLPQLHHSFA